MTMSSRCAGHQVSPCHLMSMSHSSDETQGCEYEVMAVQTNTYLSVKNTVVNNVLFLLCICVFIIIIISTSH